MIRSVYFGWICTLISFGCFGLLNYTVSIIFARNLRGFVDNFSCLFQVGNQEAYEDIDNQRKTEKSYHFSLSEEPNDQVDDANEETVSLEDDNIENNGEVIQNENLWLLCYVNYFPVHLPKPNLLFLLIGCDPI